MQGLAANRSLSGVVTVMAAMLVGLASASSAAAVDNEMTLISRADGAAGVKGSGFRINDQPAVSEDGRYVAFESNATNLDPTTPTRPPTFSCATR